MLNPLGIIEKSLETSSLEIKLSKDSNNIVLALNDSGDTVIFTEDNLEKTLIDMCKYLQNKRS
jgi:hypothetical protein